MNYKGLYLGKNVHIILADTSTYTDVWGKVTSVSKDGCLKGTWGPFEAKIGIDYISLED